MFDINRHIQRKSHAGARLLAMFSSKNLGLASFALTINKGRAICISVTLSYNSDNKVIQNKNINPFPHRHFNNVIYQFCTEIAAYILHLFFGFSLGNDHFRFHSRKQEEIKQTRK